MIFSHVSGQYRSGKAVVDSTELSSLLLAITPFEQPDLPLARALRRQQVPVAVDLGRDAQQWQNLLLELSQPAWSGVGVRLGDAVDVAGLPVPQTLGFAVVCATQLAKLPADWRALPLIAQVCSQAEAEAALAAGVQGLIAKGQESGGRSGAESAFVLLQRLLPLAEAANCPIWCQGGIGLHTAAAAVAGGATGVVIDAVLAGLPECSLPAAQQKTVLAMDGSEVRELAGYQVMAPSVRELAGCEAFDREAVCAALAGQHDKLLWPVGQDVALAKTVLAECGSVENLCQTLRMRIAGQIRQAQTLRVLDAGNAWARSHGVRYPIAQGPMTRVSDTAEFCAAVAEGGALPFLALSLMREAACRQLLDDTRKQLGNRPWGIGVLGFAAPEILDPQLALIREYWPAAVLLAGGRPSQARPLIELGIPTYLHVPSPGLLDLFLKDGATHFVFEGRECGGHVGPRYSFVLWEQAVQRLLQAEKPEQLHILFAGGIHDERSAAMVATLAAPLAALGAKVAVLMGSAYIATAEAVNCGAVLADFQAQSLAGDATALVETAPGHAIRCLPSGFVDLFAREKARLQADGVEQKTAWQQLEALTVGRLRVASKGVERQGDALVAVDSARQRAEGMYMIGQLMALRDRVTTIAELHAAVTSDATAYLARQQQPAFLQRARSEAVAIVGMACLYPGSPDLEAYWRHIVEGDDMVSEVPAERWNAAQYYSPAGGPGKTPSRWGGFIADTPFDPLAFGIPPQSLAAIEPVQLLSLAVARQALADAGYEERYFDRGKTSVIFGAEGGMDLANQYNFRNLYPQYCGDLPPALDAVLPALTEDSFPGVLVNVISGRIANRLGLGGVNYSVDSACASSLTAIELAVKELRNGSSEMVLAGGADFHNGISDYLQFASVGALSPSGHCRSFDSSADGICLGEGVGIIVLKRLSDAEQDGDRIYAVIDGVAGSSDGKGLGLTAPRKEGQKRALERAYWQAGVLPAEVGLVEAHGTGTVVGDRTELKTLSEIYNAGGAVPAQAVLGSVKSQIGHTKCAAGIAGVIKVAKALHHRVLPPTLKITAPNPGYQAGSPFQLNAVALPWAAAQPRAAVSAFGFGGANFHAVLSAYPAHRASQGAVDWPCELFALRGENRAAVKTQLQSLHDFIAASTAPLSLRDLATTAWQLGQGPVQCAFVASDLVSLQQRLSEALRDDSAAELHWRADSEGGSGAESSSEEGSVAWLFSGQGSQYPGMLRELFVYFPGLLPVLEAGAEYAPALYPPTAYSDSERDAQRRFLTDTRNAQPALAIVELASARWLQQLGLQPDMAAGHSFGELAALAAAGVWDADTLITLARARSEAMLAAAGDDAGLMAAVSLGAEALRPLLADCPQVVLANQNSPVQTVISGPTPAVRAAMEVLKAAGVASRTIDTACAFHSPVIAAAEALFAQALAQQSLAQPQWPVYSNVTAEVHEGDAESIRRRLAEHVVSPVRFVDEIRAMHAAGARTFVEIGPRKVLCGLVNRILHDVPHRTIALDHEGKGLAGLLGTLAQLAVTMRGFDATALLAGRGRVLDLQQPLRLPATTWMVNGGRAWPLQGQPPAHAASVVLEPVAVQASAPLAGGQTLAPAQNALIDYLGNMRAMINAQRDVLLGYFGAPPAIAAAERVIDVRPVQQASAHTFTPSKAQSTALATAGSAPLAKTPAASAPDQRSVLLAIVSERTGYPVDMLDPDLDLEADLSIDSIKRVEIIGELSERLSLRSLGGDVDSLTEQLAAQKTLRAMLQWLAAHVPAQAVQTESATVSEPEASYSDSAQQRDIGDLLIAIVSQCTGYPAEALEPDLDLEADLSIDSIKRLEIVSQLVAQAGSELSDSDKDAVLEKLAALKTLRDITAWLREHPLLAGSQAAAAVTAVDTVSRNGIPLQRYVLRSEDAPAVVRRAPDFHGKLFVITDDSLGIAPRLAELLRGHGATVRVISFAEPEPLPEDIEQIDGLVHLWSLNPANRVRDVNRFFAMVRDSLIHRTRYLLVASGLGGDFGVNYAARTMADFGQGAGLAGLIKSVAKEHPDVRAHWVDLDLTESLDKLAHYLDQELMAENDLVEVAYQMGRRRSRAVVPQTLMPQRIGEIPLDEHSVVLITGGARGITARIAVALAQRYRCRLELVGRSAAVTGEESASTRGETDQRQLRQILLANHPGSKPAEIEKLLKTLLAEREFRETLAQIQAAGSAVRYTQLDVREVDDFARFIERLYEEHGRIDGVIHGAGIVEDKLLRHKTAESFQRVFDTKVRGALMLYKLVRDDVKFVVFFSSVASAFGNRGQIDYASANDVLDKLAHAWQTRIAGKVLSVNWGPWADTGMVSESLEREYARKGIGLIPQAAGVQALLAELAVQPGADGERDTQVVLMCGTVASFGGVDISSGQARS